MFLQSAFLIGLAAVLVPILVHLLSRQQVTRVELGTTRFLYEVLSDTSRRRRIRRWLLLLTRVVIVGLLGLMFARPSLPTFEDMSGGALRVVLIDQSASLQAPGENGRALDDALTAARAQADQFGKKTSVQWAAFDSHVEPLTVPAGSPPRAVPKSAADTNYAAALAWARDRIATEKAVNAQVLLITDMQMTGLASQREPGSELLPPDVPLKIIEVGRREIQNVAILSIDSRTSSSQDESVLAVAASIFNFGTMPAEDLPASAVATNGSQVLRLKKSIDVAANQASEALFDFGKVQPGIWQITIDIDIGDDLAFDNRRYAAFEINQPDSILVLDGGRADQPQSSSSYHLTLALNAVAQRETLPEASARADQVSPTEDSVDVPKRRGQFAARQWFWIDEGEPNLRDNAAALVVVASAGELSSAVVNRLEEYVTSGGRLLVFAGDAARPDALAVWRDSTLLPGKLLQTESATTMPFRITDIVATSTMLAPFLDPQTGDLSRLAFTSLLRLEVAQSDRVLASFDGQRPAITYHAVGSGRVAWFMASADDRSGAWTTSPLYLPLVRQMAADLLGRTGEGPIRFRNVGDPRSQNTAPAPVSKNAVNKAAVSKVASTSLYFDQPGFVRERPDEPLYVVNPSPKESDPTRIEPNELAKQLGVKLLSDQPDTDETRAVASYFELWPFLAAALIALLVLESALANRTAA